MKQNANRNIKAESMTRAAPLVLIMAVLLSMFSTTALAASGKTEVQGKVYEFGKDSHYEFSDSDTFMNTGAENTYGTFSISGNITIVDCSEYPNSCCTYSLYAISFYDHLLNFFCVQIHDRSETHIEKFEITANRGQGTRD